MFFILYTLALIVLITGIAAGLSVSTMLTLFVVLAALVSMWVSLARARRRASMPARERRKTSPQAVVDVGTGVLARAGRH